MIKYFIYTPILFVSMFKPTFAVAEENRVTYTSILKFSAGVVAAALIHEGSHGLVAGITDTQMHWEIGTYNQPIGFTDKATSNAKGVAIYSAGLISQAIGSEIILRADKIDKNDAFVRGMMTWNILNPILYSLDYWFFHLSNKNVGNTYQGDLKGIEHYSSEPTAHGFALSMSAIAAWQGYRFLKTQSWAADWLKGDSHKVSLAPLASGGFIVTYKFKF